MSLTHHYILCSVVIVAPHLQRSTACWLAGAYLALSVLEAFA